MPASHRRTRKACASFKPASDIFPSSDTPSCSNCIFFSSKNCHKNSFDYIEPEDF